MGFNSGFKGLKDDMELMLSLNTPWECIWGVEVQLHLFLTSAFDDSERSASRRTVLPSCPGETAPVPTEQESGWATEQGWRFWRTRYLSTPATIRAPDGQVRSL